MQVFVAQRLGPRQPQFGLEPAVNRQDRRLLPGQHRGQEFVFRRQGPVLHVHSADRFVEVALQFVAEFGVAQQLVNFIRLRTARILHGKKILVKSSRPTHHIDRARARSFHRNPGI